MGGTPQTPQAPQGTHTPAAPAQPAAAQPPVQPPQAPQDPNLTPTQQLREQVQQPLPPGAQAPQPQAPQPPPQGVLRPVQQQDGSWVLETPTRQRYVGSSPQDVYDQVTNAQVSATQRLAEVTRERERLARIAREAVGAPVDSATGRAQQPQAAQFDPQVYRQISEVDPVLAAWYVDMHRFGFNSIEETQARIPQIFEDYEAMVQDRTIGEFHRMAPDFPATKEAVDALMNAWERTGSEFNADNLMHVHRSLMYAHTQDPNIGYSPVRVDQFGRPMQEQPQQQQPPAVPTPQQAMERILVGPQGNYAFHPDRGFGYVPEPGAFAPPVLVTAPRAPAAPPAPAYAVPTYAPAPTAAAPQPSPYAYPQTAGPYAPAPQTYPLAPAAPEVPVPTVAAGGYGAYGAGMDENALYGMDRAQLRGFVDNITGFGRQ